MPPLCPITKQFLNYINSRYKDIPNNKINHSYVIKIYKEFEKLSNNGTIAEWELIKFNEIGDNQ